MKCIICKHGETKAGATTVTLERNGFTYIVKTVPAQVCPNCGEVYVAEPVTDKLLKSAARIAKTGALVDIREYLAA